MKVNVFAIGLAVAMGLGFQGCATRGYVDQQINKTLATEVGAVHMEIEAIRENVETSRDDIEALKVSDKRQEEKLEKGMELVEEALLRAEEAQKLAKGKLIYEVTISDESVPFAYNKAELSEDAKASLDLFATVLLEENQGVFIEIQGHTDDKGSEAYNLDLGQARADAVRNYLYTKHQMPLHRMATFSYGESEPVAPNDSEANRAKNRRVMLIVME